MPRRSFVLFAAATALLLSAIAVPTGASAVEAPVSRVVLKDPAGDVWVIGDGENDQWVSAGDVPTADVVRAVVRHGFRFVVVRMTFTDLRRVEPQFYSALIVSRRQYGAVFVSTGPRQWNGHHQLMDGTSSDVKCPRLRHRIDYEAEQITMLIPRPCIGQPRWVKVGMSNFMFRGTGQDFQEITDNPHSARAEGPLTERLYRAVG
jgi:hypothetical protein